MDFVIFQSMLWLPAGVIMKYSAVSKHWREICSKAYDFVGHIEIKTTYSAAIRVPPIIKTLLYRQNAHCFIGYPHVSMPIEHLGGSLMPIKAVVNFPYVCEFKCVCVLGIVIKIATPRLKSFHLVHYTNIDPGLFMHILGKKAPNLSHLTWLPISGAEHDRDKGVVLPSLRMLITNLNGVDILLKNSYYQTPGLTELYITFCTKILPDEGIKSILSFYRCRSITLVIVLHSYQDHFRTRIMTLLPFARIVPHHDLEQYWKLAAKPS